MYAIETSSLTKLFDKTKAVDNLDLTVKSGEIFGLVGPDGAGKTTTIRLLCGLLTPKSGYAKVLGFDTIKQTERLKENFGYMSQKFSLYQDLTVEENLNFFADIRKVKKADREERKKRLFEFSRLDKFKDRLAGKLSGGMKQKLALSCTLIHTPKILFLDEPTTGVDPISRKEFWDILKSFEGQMTIFVSTPYMDEAEKCANVALMHNGSILVKDTPQKIKALMPQKVIELTSSDIRKAAQMLEGKVDYEMFGDRLHIVSDDIEAVRNAGNFTLKEISPSLEDVFVWMIKKNTR